MQRAINYKNIYFRNQLRKIMKGSEKVLQQLSKLLRGELAARDQYFTHSRMYLDWGLNKLYERYKVVGDLKEAIAICETEQDYQSRKILLGILTDTEEDHAYWLEKQLKLIEQLGLQNYLQSQA